MFVRECVMVTSSEKVKPLAPKTIFLFIQKAHRDSNILYNIQAKRVSLNG